MDCPSGLPYLGISKKDNEVAASSRQKDDKYADDAFRARKVSGLGDCCNTSTEAITEVFL
jgi:hypothetical protein